MRVSNRKIMRAMVADNIKDVRRVTSMSADSRLPSELEEEGNRFSVDWVNGHPERREIDRLKWDLRDWGIYLADEAAQAKSTSGCTTGRSTAYKTVGTADQAAPVEIIGTDVTNEKIKICDFRYITCKATEFILQYHQNDG